MVVGGGGWMEGHCVICDKVERFNSSSVQTNECLDNLFKPRARGSGGWLWERLEGYPEGGRTETFLTPRKPRKCSFRWDGGRRQATDHLPPTLVLLLPQMMCSVVVIIITLICCAEEEFKVVELSWAQPRG